MADINACKRFLTNTPSKQLLHVLSEVVEVVVAFIKWKYYKTRYKYGVKRELDYVDELSLELVDLQTTCETMLVIIGADVQSIRLAVTNKNRRRGYMRRAE